MKTIFAIDPGSKESAWMLLDDRGYPRNFSKATNSEVLRQLSVGGSVTDTHLVIESMVSYGQVVGEEVFTTCRWIGRFEQAWLSRGGTISFLLRKDIKIHVAGSASAKDSGVRESLIQKFGGVDKAIGGKKCGACKGRGRVKKSACFMCSTTGLATPKGPLFGIASDIWSALAIGITAHENPTHNCPRCSQRGHKICGCTHPLENQ